MGNGWVQRIQKIFVPALDLVAVQEAVGAQVRTVMRLIVHTPAAAFHAAVLVVVTALAAVSHAARSF